MNSPFESTSPFLPKDLGLDEKPSDMSPVTDLAFTMKSLKTMITGTPNRRISWSNPFPNGTPTRCDFSPSTDSPMLQEILTKNMKRLKSTSSRKMLLSTDDDKENFHPEVDLDPPNAESSRNDDSIMENDSQDSGYGGTLNKHLCSMGSTPRVKVRSSLFTNTDMDDLDGLFPMDEDIDMEPTSEFGMQSLLTKPLCNIEDSSTFTIRKGKGKLPSRRCLTMEMDSSCDSTSMKLDLSSEIELAFSSTSDKSNTAAEDLEPLKRLPFKRPDPDAIFPWQNKRRKSSPCVNSPDMSTFFKQRSFSETATTIMQAVQKADLQPDLIGDCSRLYALPLVKGRHQDLKCISPDTLVKLLKGDFHGKIDSYTLVDCRYPYEFEGGHIQGAQNIYTKEEILQKFLENVPESTERNAIIFHCEFSSERAPNLCRFLRNKDREINECNYPKLHHPEIYLLDGGYKAFFANFREYCEPRDYKPMNHKDHSSELRLFRAKSKSWGSDSKSRYKMKSCSENNNV